MSRYIILQVTDDEVDLTGVILGTEFGLGVTEIPVKIIGKPEFVDAPFPVQSVTITGTIAPTEPEPES